MQHVRRCRGTGCKGLEDASGRSQLIEAMQCVGRSFKLIYSQKHSNGSRASFDQGVGILDIKIKTSMNCGSWYRAALAEHFLYSRRCGDVSYAGNGKRF